VVEFGKEIPKSNCGNLGDYAVAEQMESIFAIGDDQPG
jgi:hypothetical protein